jgi:cytochrome P450
MEMHANDDFTSAFDYASGATAERFQNPLWFITEIVLGAKLRRSVKLIKAYGREIVSKAVADNDRHRLKIKDTVAHTKALDSISGSLVQSLLDALGEETLVADAALNYLSAGRDTTAQALTWTFHLLMGNERALASVRAEVARVLGSTSSTDVDSTLFNPSAMPYTLAVFYEALRLYPPIPVEIKQCVKGAVLPDGTEIPPGAVVVWCPWAMNRSLQTWGTDADDFRPERWLDENDHGPVVVSRSAAEYPVFNGGARLCLGKRMAELIAVQVIGAVAWEFDFEPADVAGVDIGNSGGERVSKSSLTLPMEGGLPVFVKLRDPVKG